MHFLAAIYSTNGHLLVRGKNTGLMGCHYNHHN